MRVHTDQVVIWSSVRGRQIWGLEAAEDLGQNSQVCKYIKQIWITTGMDTWFAEVCEWECWVVLLLICVCACFVWHNVALTGCSCCYQIIKIIQPTIFSSSLFQLQTWLMGVLFLALCLYFLTLWSLKSLQGGFDNRVEGIGKEAVES